MHKRNNNFNGGASNKKMQKFPRILDYLEIHHEDVYKLFDDLAMHGALTPKRGGSITFLLPDKKYTAKIRKEIESDEPEKATDILSSLILLDLFESPEDFIAKKDDIPNLYGHRLIVKSATKDSVVVENGTLTIDKKFKPFERQGKSPRNNVAVWLLDGEVKVDTPETTHKYSNLKNNPRKIRGSDEKYELNEIFLFTCKHEVLTIGNAVEGKFSAMLVVVSQIIYHINKGRDSNYILEYEAARSVLTRNAVIDFFLLFKTPKLFNPSKILECVKQPVVDAKTTIDVYQNFFSDQTYKPQYTKYPEVLFGLNNKFSEIIKVRDLICVEFLNHSDEIARYKIIDMYQDFDKSNKLILRIKGSNSIRVIDNIYPQSIFDIFRENPGMHLALDEIKFIIYFRLKQIRFSIPQSNDPFFQSNDLRMNEYIDLFSYLTECYNEFGDPNKSMIIEKLSGESFIIKDFIKTMCYHFPLCNLADNNKDFEHYRVHGGHEVFDNRCNDLVDLDAEFDEELEKNKNAEYNLSKSALRELTYYVQTHNGEYPKI